MRIRRVLASRQCKQCDTFSSPFRLTCKSCRTPVYGVRRHRPRSAAAARRAAGLVEGLGNWALVVLAIVAVVRRGTALDLFDLMPALAAYGAARLVALLLEDAAGWIAPGPAWREAAEDLHAIEEKLASSESTVIAVDELNRYGGVAPVIGILHALAARAMYEKEAAENEGNVQDALAQERLEEALKTAARELNTDMEAAWY
ncbi:hypothetical protein P1P68_02275 [Streptomyces scabiei]|uniref:hypothetical protein n=1 Tax=Streptomyces scabiei TaxID=1930 RepID=UPI0029902E71|nr:hypothetical protein [Streptomyces scabiei]MDW8803661.1 hypothetical protein [Streptomyces scabiei]